MLAAIQTFGNKQPRVALCLPWAIIFGAFQAHKKGRQNSGDLIIPMKKTANAEMLILVVSRD